LEWSSDPTTLEEDIEDLLADENRLMSQSMMQAILDIGVEFSLIPVSSKTTHGFLDIYGELSRILNLGERFGL